MCEKSIDISTVRYKFTNTESNNNLYNMFSKTVEYILCIRPCFLSFQFEILAVASP